jgi:predicted small lipoprotein YifL
MKKLIIVLILLSVVLGGCGRKTDIVPPSSNTKIGVVK